MSNEVQMPTFAATPTLTGTRVQLRPFREADHDALWAMVNDEEGNRLTGTHVSFTRDQVDRWYRSRHGHDDRLDLAIATLTDDRCVGEVVLNDLDPHNRSCAFRISLTGRSTYGRGYGTDATRLILEHAFGAVGLHRVELEVYAFNARAIHVYRQCGFSLEGLRRQALWWEDAFHDAVLMSILAPDWRAERLLEATRPLRPADALPDPRNHLRGTP